MNKFGVIMAGGGGTQVCALIGKEKSRKRE